MLLNKKEYSQAAEVFEKVYKIDNSNKDVARKLAFAYTYIDINKSVALMDKIDKP